MKEEFIQVAVVGAVKAPGLQRVHASESLANVIELAGGFDSTAIVRKVQILRGTQSTLITAATTLGLDLKDGDVIYVPGKKQE